MRPVLYGAGATSFTNHGLGSLADAISCVVKEERNGLYELTMTYPITGLHYSDLQVSRIILALPCDNGTEQPFRIYEISRPINGVVTVYARHISDQLRNIPVTPFTASSVVQALAGLKSYAAEDCPFDFWTDKETAANFAVTVPCSIKSRLGGVAGSILDCYGGEYEFDGYTVKLHAARGSDTGVTIRYGKNLKNVVQDENIDSCVTGILPYWYGQSTEVLMMLPELIVQGEYADNFPYNRTIAVDFSQNWQVQPTEAQLRAAAVAYINNNAIGVPKVSVTVDFVPLWQTANYNKISNDTVTVNDGELIFDSEDSVIMGDVVDVAPLERVKLCDTVSVYYPALGVSAKAKVVATEYDVLLERYNSITIGDARSTISDQIANAGTEIDHKVADSVSMLRKAIVNATDLITGNLGGYIVTKYNADGYPYELLIMDTPDIDSATKVWRWNASGLGYSDSGYDGEYGLAITADGSIVADYITTGTLNANLMRAGLLTDQYGYNYWNLETGEFSLQGYVDATESVVQTVVEYATGSSSAEAPTTGWSANTPTWSAGLYVWQRVMSVYGDGHTSYSEPACIQGAKGADGTSVTILGAYDSLDQLYYDHPTGSTGDAYMVDGDLYVWVTGATGYLEVLSGEIALDDANLVEVYRGTGWVYAGQIQGDQGEKGETGLGYTSITPQYYLSTSNSTQTGGSWSTDQPTWTTGRYLWSRSYITWTDGTSSTTTPYLEGAINSANETAYSANETAEEAAEAVATLDSSLDQQGVFNRLTNNGVIQGIYLKDNKLYINGTYIATGIITDATGSNWWNLDTGEFHNGTYVSSSDMATYVTDAVDSALQEAEDYADSIQRGNVTYYQSYIPEDAEAGDTWYNSGTSVLYDYVIDTELEVDQGEIAFGADEVAIIGYTIYHQRLYWYDGAYWREIEDSKFDSYPTTETVTSSIDSAVGMLSAQFAKTLQSYATLGNVEDRLGNYPTTEQMTTAIEASAEGVVINMTHTLQSYATIDYTDAAASDALSDANDYTDDKLTAYSTTEQMTAAIAASASGIAIDISHTLEGYTTTEQATTISSSAANSAYEAAVLYADGLDLGNHEFYQSTEPTDPREKDTWYVTGDDSVPLNYGLEFSQGILAFGADEELYVGTPALAGRYYSWDGERWLEIYDRTFELYPTRVEHKADLDATAESLTSSYQEYIDGKLTAYSTIAQTSSAIRLTVSNYYNKTEIDQKADSLTLSASMSGKTATITLTGDGVTTQARELNFSGYATFTDLSGTMSTTINGANIETGTITATQIKSATITSTQIASETIKATNIAAKTITAGVIADSAIENAKIKDSAITDAKIANATITGAKIAGATITGAKIANGTIESTNIKDATITGAKIASATITAANISNSTITGAKIASSTIENGNIKDTTITGAKLANGTITATQIANSTITGSKIVNSSIETAKLKLQGNMSVYKSTASDAEVGGYLGYGAGKTLNDTTAGIHMYTGSAEVIATTAGARISYGTTNAFASYSTGNKVYGPFYVGGKIVLEAAYGSSLPTSGLSKGQLFFKI